MSLTRVVRVTRASVVALALALPVVAAPAASASNLGCVTWSDGGSTGGATCTGSGNWRVAVYCDFPSVSPVYSGNMFGSGAASATCWFGAHVQKVAIEQW